MIKELAKCYPAISYTDKLLQTAKAIVNIKDIARIETLDYSKTKRACETLEVVAVIRVSEPMLGFKHKEITLGVFSGHDRSKNAEELVSEIMKVLVQFNNN